MTLREPQIYIVKSASGGECDFGEKVGDWVNGYCTAVGPGFQNFFRIRKTVFEWIRRHNTVFC